MTYRTLATLLFVAHDYCATVAAANWGLDCWSLAMVCDGARMCETRLRNADAEMVDGKCLYLLVVELADVASWLCCITFRQASPRAESAP